VGGTALSDCISCPAGQYCPLQTTTPTPCPAGAYRLISGGADSSDCSSCPVGNYCPIGTVTPVQCSAGTYRVTTGASQLSDCILCLPGTYSLQVGRSSNCPLCEVNFYCRTSTSKDICPLHTVSAAGSYSRINCLCDPGFQCTYYKQIQAVVTLNATLWEFNNNVNGVKTAFIAAMAAAAGVQPSQITINDVMSKSRRRRLLALDSDGELIDVHASIIGSVKLKDLDQHLNRHKENLHVQHQWKRAQKIEVVPIQPTTLPVVINKPVIASRAYNEKELRTRAAKLVSAKHLMESLNKF